MNTVFFLLYFAKKQQNTRTRFGFKGNTWMCRLIVLVVQSSLYHVHIKRNKQLNINEFKSSTKIDSFVGIITNTQHMYTYPVLIRQLILNS